MTSSLKYFFFKFIDSLINTNDVYKASKLKQLFRYQDDCIVFGDKDESGSHVFDNSIDAT